MRSHASLSRSRQRAFSLVEVVLAVGVVAFAFVAILGLIPAGMNQFRQAVDTSVCSQIAQRILMDAQQTDFDLLVDANATKLKGADYTFRAPTDSGPAYRYFDEQGNEVKPVSAGSLTPAEKLLIIYYANTRVTVRAMLPRTADANASDILDGIAIVTVQVIHNPGHATLKTNPQTNNTKDNSYPTRNLVPNTQTGVSIKTYTALIGRNQ